MTRIFLQQDFPGGLLLALFGVLGLFLGADFEMGSATTGIIADRKYGKYSRS